MSEPLALQPAHATAKRLFDVIVDDSRAKLAVRTAFVAFDTGALVDIEDKRDCQHIVLACGAYQRGAILRLDAGGVDDDQPPQPETQPGDIVQRVECVDADRSLGSSPTTARK